MQANKIRIGVVGMGPVGMILAVKLKEAGCDVAVCDKDEFKMKKIREEGIVLENVMTASVSFDKVYDSVGEMEKLDLDYLIFSLKSYHTANAAKEAERLNSEKLTVIAAQNGIEVEELLTEEVFVEPGSAIEGGWCGAPFAFSDLRGETAFGSESFLGVSCPEDLVESVVLCSVELSEEEEGLEPFAESFD